MSESFLKYAKGLEVKLGVKPKNWKNNKKVFQYSFNKTPKIGDEELYNLQLEVQKNGYHLIVWAIWRGEVGDQLLLFETSNKYEVIADIDTNIPNYNLSNEDIIKWLKVLETDGYNFFLLGCSLETIVGVFDKKINLDSAKSLIPRFKSFCPDILLSVPGRRTYENLAKHMADINGFALPWMRWEP